MRQAFEDQVAVITGATGQIGRAAAACFLDGGATVVSCDISVAHGRLQPAADERSNHFEAHLDVTRQSACRELVDALVRRWGRLDVLVNGAGTLTVKPLLELTEADWDRSLAVNLKGTFFMCQAALPAMMERGAGSIVNVASISGKVGGVLAGADYSAAKAGVICLTKSLAKTGIARGVRVNSVAPGAVYSPMLERYYEDHAEAMAQYESGHPMGRFGRPAEVAAAIAFLASDRAAYINGTCLDVNGGSLMMG